MTTKCSDASDVTKSKYVSRFPTKLNGNIGWSFFSLEEDADFDITKDFPDNTLHLRNDYTYKEPDSEDDRMCTLMLTIRNHYQLDRADSEFKVAKVSSGRGNRECYCEYTGGGDIYVRKKGQGSTLSIVNLENLATTPSSSTESIPGLIIEGNHEKDKLTQQLICNTILCCVTQFIKQCKENQISSEFVRKMKKLSGYSIAITGMGYFGFYKLTMEFGTRPILTAKYEPVVRAKPVSAALVDQALDYFFKEVSQ